MVVKAPVTAVAPADTSVCFGEAILLSASGGETYTWSPVDSLNNPYAAQIEVSPLTTTTYVVEVANVCFSDTESVTVLVHPLPEANAGSDVTINIGETTVLNGMATGDYAWTPATALSDASILTPTARPLATMTYVLTSGSLQGCKNTDSVTVTVTNIVRVFDSQCLFAQRRCGE